MGADGSWRHSLLGWVRGGGYGILLLAVLLVLIGALGEGGIDTLQYARDGIAQGQLWRLATGHLTHADPVHLLLNLAGLVVVVLLFPGEFSVRGWLIVGIAALLAVDAGLWWFNPEVTWYVGLSGVLHGILAAGAVAWWKSQPPYLAALLTGLLLLKLGWEHWQGALGWSGGLPVIVDAHLYGAVGGAVAGLAMMAGRRRGALRP